MSDISATASLDATKFSIGLQQALSQTRKWKTDVSKNLNFDPIQKMTAATKKLRVELSQLKAPKLDVDAKATAAGIRETSDAAKAAITSTRDLDRVMSELRAEAAEVRQEFQAGNITRDEMQAQMRALRTATNEAAVSQAGFSKEILSGNSATKQTDEVVKALGISVRNVRSAYIAGRTGVDEYRNASEQLKSEINALFQSTSLTEAQQLKLNIASATAERGLAMLRGEASRLGLAQGVAIGTTMSLREQQEQLATQTANVTGAYRQLAGALTAVFATAGLARYIRTLKTFSDESDEARTAVKLFFQDVSAGGGDLNIAATELDRVTSRLQVADGFVSRFGGNLVRLGLDATQSVKLLEVAGAMALNASVDLERGLDLVQQAIISGRAQSLRQLGVLVDFANAEERLARQLGVTRSRLNESQLAAARYEAVLKTGAFAVDRIEDRQRDFFGSTNRLNTALTNLRQNAGDVSQVFLGPLNDGLANVVNLFNALPRPLQAVVIGTTLLSTTLAGVAIAYATIRAVLVRTQVVQNAVNALVTRETITRTALGGSLLNLAARYKLLTAAQLESTAATRANAASLGLLGASLQATRAGFATALTGVKRLTVASARFALTPVGLVLTGIAAAVGLVTAAVRRNDAIVRPAFDAFSKSVQSVRAAIEPLTRSITHLFREGGALANAWRTTLIVVAKALATTMIALAEATERAAIGFRFLEEVGTIGVARAWQNATTANDELTASYARLREELDAGTRAALANQTAMSGGRDTINDVGNAATLSAEQLAELRQEAEATAKTLQERFRDIQISLMPDGEEKAIRSVRDEYRRLREEIRQTAEENPEFEAEGFLARSFELEQQAVLAIQKKYADDRRQQAERQGRELEDTIRERERAIVDARTRGRQTEIEALTLEFQRRQQDTERLYDDLITKAREYGQDTTTLESQRTRELLAIQDAYRRDVLAVYDQLRGEIDDRQRNLLREAMTARGDTRGLAGLDFADAERDLEDFYANARAQASGNAALLAAIEEQEAATRAAAWRRYWDEVTRLANERGTALVEREEAIARARAELADDDAGALALAAAAELREINRAYDDLERAALGNASELARIARLRNDEIALANDRLAEGLKGLADTARAEAFQPVIDTLLAGLEDANTGTLRSIRNQLESWRTAYGSNGEIATLVNAALDQVATAYARTRAAVAQEIDKLTTDSRKLLDGLRMDDAARGLSAVEATLFTAAQRVREIRQQQEALTASLADATEEEAARILEAAAQLEQGIRIIEANATADARGIAEEAVRAYEQGLARARADAGKAAFDAVTSDISAFMTNLVSVNENALKDARARLHDLFNTLTDAGVPRDALDGVQAYIDQVNAQLDRHAGNLAAFAAEQFALVRQVGQAVLSEREARELSIATLDAEVDARQRALREAERNAAAQKGTAQEVVDAQRNVVTAQLGVLDAYRETIDELENQRTAVVNVFRDLPTDSLASVEDALVGTRDELVRQVEAAQAAGESYDDYADTLTAAIEANEQLERISESRSESIEREADLLSQARANEARLTEVRRQAALAQLQIATTEAGRTTALRRSIAASREAIDQAHAEIESLRALAQQYADAGDQQRALQARNDLVQTGERIIASLRTELSTLQALSIEYRKRADEMRSIKQDVADILTSIRTPGSGETPSARDEIATLHAMQHQNATLEEQREQFQRIGEAVEALREAGDRLTIFDQQDLQAAETVFNAQAAAEERANREREELAERQARTIEQQLESAIATLTGDVNELNALLTSVFDTPDDGLSNVFQGMAVEAGTTATRVREIGDEVDALRAKAAGLADDLGITIDISGSITDPGAWLDAIVNALPTTQALDGVGARAGRAYARAFSESLESLDADLAGAVGESPELVNAATLAGEAAGSGLMTAFAHGIRSNRGALLNAVDDILREVRARLPSSDAKKGPLSDLTHSGRMLLRTFVTGAQQERSRLGASMDRLLQVARPGAAFTAANASGTGVLPAIGTLNLNGSPTSTVPGPLGISARQMAEAGMREAAIQLRMRGRR